MIQSIPMPYALNTLLGYWKSAKSQSAALIRVPLSSTGGDGMSPPSWLGGSFDEYFNPNTSVPEHGPKPLELFHRKHQWNSEQRRRRVTPKPRPSHHRWMGSASMLACALERTPKRLRDISGIEFKCSASTFWNNPCVHYTRLPWNNATDSRARERRRAWDADKQHQWQCGGGEG